MKREIIKDKVTLAKAVVALVRNYGGKESEEDIIERSKNLTTKLLKYTDTKDAYWTKYTFTEDEFELIKGAFDGHSYGILGRTLEKPGEKRTVLRTEDLLEVVDASKTMKGPYEFIVGKQNEDGEKTFGLGTMAELVHKNRKHNA